VPNVQYKTPDDGHRRCPKRVEFYDNKIGLISASGWLFKKKSITMHGNMNVKCVLYIWYVCKGNKHLSVSLFIILLGQYASNELFLTSDVFIAHRIH
jgi:hypothetical protein